MPFVRNKSGKHHFLYSQFAFQRSSSLNIGFKSDFVAGRCWYRKSLAGLDHSKKCARYVLLMFCIPIIDINKMKKAGKQGLKVIGQILDVFARYVVSCATVVMTSMYGT